MIRYCGSSYYLPEFRMDGTATMNWSGSSVDFLENKIGIKSRAIAGPDESTSQIGFAAVQVLLQEQPLLDLNNVRLLIVVTQNPDYQLPHTAAILQNELGLSTDCACFDVSLGCSGFVYALSLAKGFMQEQNIEDAIIVTADPYSKIMGRNDRDTVSVFGDAAAATWLSNQKNGARIGIGDFGTDGSGAEHLKVEKGGARYPLGGVWRTERESPMLSISDTPKLYMNGRAIFNFMMTRVPKTVDAAITQNGLTLDQIDLFVFHQASKYLIETLSQYMRLDPSKVPIEIEDSGNTVSSTIPITLRRLHDRPGGLAGKTVLVSGFGVGLSWGSNVLRF